MTNRSSEADLDCRLREYFQTEVPQPWPAAPLPSSASPRQGYGHFARLALVASIGLLLAGYITLASFFPRTSNVTIQPGQNPHIGQRHLPPK